MKRATASSLMFSLALNVGLFAALAYVNRRFEGDVDDIPISQVQVYVPPSEVEAAPPEELEPLEPELVEPEPLELIESFEQPTPLTPRLPIDMARAPDPLALAVAVTDLDVTVPSVSGPMELTDVDRPPSRESGRMPPYPTWAESSGLEAVLRVEFVVNADGSVSDARVTRLDGDERFRRLIEDAVNRWRFAAGSYRGQSVPVRCCQTLRYRLKG